MKNKFVLFGVAGIAAVAMAILLKPSGVESGSDTVPGRWYTESQLNVGQKVFDSNCMVCHGDKGQGLADDWKQPLADGSYPPPPLNGTAHTWHHPVSQLIRTINSGGIPLGGKMPAFESKLTDQEKMAVVAYFQSWWSDEIYNAWIDRGGLAN